MSPAACVAAMIAGGSNWNPLSLPGLQWFLHPDDATDVVSGEINSLVCRKTGLSFAALGSTNRMQLDTTSRPGHKVAGCENASQDYLCLNDSTVANALNSTSFTMFAFVSPSTTTGDRIQHSAGSSFGITGQRVQWRTGANSMTIFIQDNNSVADYWCTPAAVFSLNTFSFFLSTWNGTTANHYVNGVLQGSRTLTTQTTSGLSNVLWGGQLGKFSVSGMCTGVMSATNRAKLYAWVLANA